MLTPNIISLSPRTINGGPRTPTSYCKDLETPYASLNGTHFNLVCATDYPAETDLLSVWVFQYVDCIHACISFNVKHRGNATCTGISYLYDLAYGRSYGYLDKVYLGGNCFLKGEFPINPVQNEVVDSAFYSNLGIPPV